MPGEPTRIRRAVVVENPDRFEEGYQALVVVPLTTERRLVDATFALRIDPTPENGASVTSWALPHNVNSVSLRRAKPTLARITVEQLRLIRQRIALALDIAVAPSER
jgi:mRNA interferase MazF